MDTGYEANQLKRINKNEIKLSLDEEKIKEIIKARKRLEKTKLLVRRVITFAINIVFLVIGWVLIFMINLYDDSIQDFLKHYRLLNKIASFVPSLCLSFVNTLIPTLTKMITKYEAWDFASTMIKQ